MKFTPWNESYVTWVCDCQIPGKLSPELQEMHDAVVHKVRAFGSEVIGDIQPFVNRSVEEKFIGRGTE